MQKNLCAAALCLMLAACGGGGSSGAPVSAPVSQAPKCTPLAVVKIQLFGDSTQAGYDSETHTDSVNAPPIVLQRLMDARFGAGKVAVESRAVWGTTTVDLVNGTDGLNKPWPGSVNADITVVNMGINDMRLGVTLADYTANLRKIGVTVYETPNPVHDVDWMRPGFPEAMRAVAAEKGAPVADVYNYVSNLPNWQTYVADGVHPNAPLYALIVTNVLQPKLEPMVAKLLCQ